MGFRVETSEIKSVIEDIQSTVKQEQSQIQQSKSALKSIVSSQDLEGKVKKSIDAEINNSIIALSTGIIDCYKLLNSEVLSLYQSFKSTTGEQSDQAILDEDALNTGKKTVKQFQEEHSKLFNNISKEYESISDLIALELPKNTFNDSSVQTYNHLEKIINKVHSFDQTKEQSTVETLSQSFSQYINALTQVSALGYLNEDFQHFINDKTFLNQINDIDSQIKAAEKTAKKQQERELKQQQDSYRKNHPVLAYINQFSENIGDTWSDIIHGTKNLNIPIIEEVALFSEGVISGTGELISDIVIGGSQLVSGALNYIHLGYNSLTKQKTEQWRLNEIAHSNETLFKLSQYGLGMLALSTPLANGFEPGRTLSKKAMNTNINLGRQLLSSGIDYIQGIGKNITTGNWEGIGKNTFDIVSTFVGASEIKSIITGERIIKSAKVLDGIKFIQSSALDSYYLQLGRVEHIQSNIKYYSVMKQIQKNINPKTKLPKIMDTWENKPSIELYNKYKNVYTNPKYFNQGSSLYDYIDESIAKNKGITINNQFVNDKGEVIIEKEGACRWPKNDGFLNKKEFISPSKGMIFDRYGSPSGEFLGTPKDSFEKRALAPFTNSENYHRYFLNIEILNQKHYKIESGTIAPWFGEKGGGKQFLFYNSKGKRVSVEKLIEEKILVEY